MYPILAILEENKVCTLKKYSRASETSVEVYLHFKRNETSYSS